jgi:hypothetical protein
MPRRQRRRYYNPWGQGRYEFDKWLLNLAPAEGQNAFEAQNAYNEYARNSEIANAQNYAGETREQGNMQGDENNLQNAFQNILSPTWQNEHENAQAAINEALHSYSAYEIQNALGSKRVFEINKNTFDNRPWVKNNSNKIIYCKTEKGGDALPVQPYGILNEAIDGVATHKYCAKVYKVVGGIKVEIESNGDVSVFVRTGEGDTLAEKYFGDLLKGGWKDTAWWMWVRQMELEKWKIPVENNQWNEIFYKAAHICEH